MPQVTACPHCYDEIQITSSSCPFCKKDLRGSPEWESKQESMGIKILPSGRKIPVKYCFACNEAIDALAEICVKCGVRQLEPARHEKSQGEKNKGTATLLAFFLGGLGAHKFYLGQGTQGFFYILFCWTFIPSIIAFIEFIMYLTMSEQEFMDKYG